MSVTPNEIRNAQFPTTMRGYSRDDVDTFLQNTADALEAALTQLAEIKSAHEALKENHHKLENLEETLKSTLVDAKQTANSIIDTAKSDVQRILTEAHDKARQIHARELDNAVRIKEQIEQLTGIRDSYRRRVEELITNHLTLITELENVRPDSRALPILEELSETADLSEHLPSLDDGGQVEFCDAIECDAIEDVEPTQHESAVDSDESPQPANTPETEPAVSQNAPADNADNGVSAEVMELAENSAGEPHPHSKTLYERRFVEDIVEVKEVPSNERQPVSLRIAQAADRAISEGKLKENARVPQAQEVDEELYKKLRKTDELAAPEPPVQVQQRQKQTQSANNDPTRDLRGEDGIIVFGRREDRERAVEENAKVLSDLDSVVDKFAEELSKIEKS